MSGAPTHLSLGSGANLSNFSLGHNELLIERAADSNVSTILPERTHANQYATEKWPKVRVPLRNVLWAGLDGALFELSVLAKKKAKAPLNLLHVTGSVSDADKHAAAAFADALMAAAYPGNTPLVSPIGISAHRSPSSPAQQHSRGRDVSRSSSTPRAVL